MKNNTRSIRSRDDIVTEVHAQLQEKLLRPSLSIITRNYAALRLNMPAAFPGGHNGLGCLHDPAVDGGVPQEGFSSRAAIAATLGEVEEIMDIKRSSLASIVTEVLAVAQIVAFGKVVVTPRAFQLLAPEDVLEALQFHETVHGGAENERSRVINHAALYLGLDLTSRHVGSGVRFLVRTRGDRAITMIGLPGEFAE